MQIGNKIIGSSCFIIAEIGINHNGSIDICQQLIDIAVNAGCDAVKFQKRTPELCVSITQGKKIRDTMWGYMTYLDYKKKIELGQIEYEFINEYCKKKNILWFASCWDIPSVDFMAKFNIPCYKIASASLIDNDLLIHIAKQNKPIILSTGMSTLEQLNHAISLLDNKQLALLHTCSAYPAPYNELNLNIITTLKQIFNIPIGYSGHEYNYIPTIAAVALGASIIERHITLDKGMWGTDQSSSLESSELEQMVKNIRLVEKCMGSYIKQITESEKTVIERLRK